MAEDQKQLKQQIDDALKNNLLDPVYINGFINVVGTGDVLLILKRNGKDIAIINLSYTVAKTLANKLSQSISDLEKETGNIIMTIDDIKDKVHESDGN